MTRPPDDPDFYADGEPTQYANYGNQGAGNQGGYPGSAEPTQQFDPEPTPEVPWYRKPAALVGLGAVIALIVAAIAYVAINTGADDATPSDVITTSSTSSSTSSSTESGSSAAVVPGPTDTVTVTPSTTTESTAPTTTTTPSTTTTTTTTTTTPSTTTTTTTVPPSTVTETRTQTETVTPPAPAPATP